MTSSGRPRPCGSGPPGCSPRGGSPCRGHARRRSPPHRSAGGSWACRPPRPRPRRRPGARRGLAAHVPAPFGPAANGVVAYEDGGDIFTADPVTGVAKRRRRRHRQDLRPVFSRDGTHVVFERTTGGDLGRLMVAGRMARPGRGDAQGTRRLRHLPHGAGPVHLLARRDGDRCLVDTRRRRSSGSRSRTEAACGSSTCP